MFTLAKAASRPLRTGNPDEASIFVVLVLTGADVVHKA